MKIKMILASVLSVAMLFALTACGGNTNSGGPGGSGDGSSDTLEVKIWDGVQVDGLQEICDQWTEQSGIKVNIQAMGWNEYFTLLEAGASGGQMPDVFWMHSTVAELYMSNDMLLKLDDYIAKDGVDLGNYYSDIIDMY